MIIRRSARKWIVHGQRHFAFPWGRKVTRPLGMAWVFLGISLGTAWAVEQPPRILLLDPPQLWRRVEFCVSNVPAATNPFDPDAIRLDATFTAPSGLKRQVPAFWYRSYHRSLSGSTETVVPVNPAQWRVRYLPQESGTHSLSVAILTNGVPVGSPADTSFNVTAGNPPARTGYVQIAPSQQYFQTGDGQALRLIGENVGWPTSRGTYDYDDWFGAMQASGQNFARLWMAPWAFGLEAEPGTLTNYRLDRAWQLDYVLELAEARGIYLLLCLDYHGMFSSTPDYWGGNDYWPKHPYNVTKGGPCQNANAFFTNATAQVLYQKRLRYLVGRYGYSTHLLAWEFFNEIDNVFEVLNAPDVYAWHGRVGGWLHTNDPFGHLVTTSLTGGSDRAELWQNRQLDFANYHSYNEASPASRLASVAQSFLSRYRKPVLIGEFGVDWRGWGGASDPYLRGLRQGIWGGALGGSAGSAMSWWWDKIHAENAYYLFASLGAVLNRTGWGHGAWSPIAFQTTGVPPIVVGDLIPEGTPFDALLTLSGTWGGLASGSFAVTSFEVCGNAANVLNGFVHGSWHNDLKRPFRLSAWLTNNSRLVLHVNSVSDAVDLRVLADGTLLFRTNLPNLDGTYQLNNEYNLDIPVNVPAGKHRIEVTNTGGDWVFLDWVRLEKVLPSDYPGGWQPSPESIGLRGSNESLLYVVAPNASYPSQATNEVLRLRQGATVRLSQWPPGPWFAEWYHPVNGARCGFTSAVATNNLLVLPLPDFREDLAGIIYPPPVFSQPRWKDQDAFQFQFHSETGGRYDLYHSDDMIHWALYGTVTNRTGADLIDTEGGSSTAIYRAAGVR